MRHDRRRSLILLTALLGASQTPAAAQWSSSAAANQAVADGSGEQGLVRLAATPDGQTWLGWFDDAGGRRELRVQLLDQAGVEQFPHDGLLVSAHSALAGAPDWDLIADSQGHCVLVFCDLRAGGDPDPYAYRIDAAGQALWGPDGVALSLDGELESAPRVAETADGAFVFLWSRAPAGGGGQLALQKLDAGGTALLGPSGISISAPLGETPGLAAVVATDDGGWIASWVRDVATIQGPRHLRAARFDAAGAALWPAPVALLDGGSLPPGYRPVLRSDGSKGALFAWQRELSGVSEVFVQRLDGAGNELFGHDGLAVAGRSARERVEPCLAGLQGGDLLVFWIESAANRQRWGLVGQRIGAGGARRWGDAGSRLLTPDGVPRSQLRCLGFGEGAQLGWLERPDAARRDARLLALRVDGDGQPLWSRGPMLLSSTASPKHGLVTARDAAGTTYLAWQDGRDDAGDIYAQNVHADGSLGLASGCNVSTYCATSPNSAGPGCKLGSSGSATLALGNFTLQASGAPAAQAALFFLGDRQLQVPFGDGLRCVGGNLARLLPGELTSVAGAASHTLDFGAAPADRITSGSTWYFQLWYRDPAGPGGSGFNLSDAVQATFCP